MTSIPSLTRTSNLIRNGENSPRGRDPLPRLLQQLAERAGDAVTVERATSRPWASALFQGRRHIIVLHLTGADASGRCARFVQGIEEAEWSLSGHFVADITIDERLATREGERVEVSALTIEDW